MDEDQARGRGDVSLPQSFRSRGVVEQIVAALLQADATAAECLLGAFDSAGLEELRASATSLGGLLHL